MSEILPISLENLVFRAGDRPILNGLTAHISTFGITALIGANGAGKSVTLRAIDGLIRPASGTISFGLRTATSVRRAFVFQRPTLVRASVGYNVALALKPLKLPAQVARTRLDDMLERVGLTPRRHDQARKLSGGERQRLALARAWLSDPELLLLDEPTANLDPGATAAIEELITEIALAGTKVILVSHNLGQVARLAEDVMLLDHGKVVEHGPARIILQSPRTPEAKAYLKGELPWTSFVAA